ncbi:CHAT domain-containing protein [Lactarius sanguifluus]|nr:CHAT domain-containing protein [Lactarius sanguifluus]
MDPKSPITDTDDYIATAQESLSLYRRSDDRRIIWVHILAMARFTRYRRSRQKEDLDKSILHYTEAILLPPISRARRFLNVVQLLFRLALALLRRSEESQQLEDVKYSIECLRYLRGLALESFNTPRNDVVTTLIQALAVQVQLEASDGTRNIEEMVVLYRELLSSPDISTDFPDYTFNSLERAINATSDRGLSIPLLDEAIECLRDAVKVCPPGSYNVKYALASMLCTRFAITQSNDDYEEATALLERVLDPNQPRKCPDLIRDLFSSLVTLLAFIRSAIYQKSEYSEVAISRLRAELSSSSIDPRIRLRATEALVIRAGVRFRDYSLSESLEEAQSCMSQVVNLSSSQSLAKYGGVFTKLNVIRETDSMPAIQEKIQQLEVLLSNTPPGTRHHRDCLKDLADWCKAKFFRTDDMSDIEQSIKYNRLRLGLTHPNDQMRANSLSSLSDVLLLAFKYTIKNNYLDESIILDYDILKLNNARHIHFQTIEKLVSSLLIGWYLLGRTEDSYEAIRLMASTIDDPYAWEPDRFRLSCKWAFLARLISHTSILTAYKSAMWSMQKSLSLAPTISIQHAHLVAMGQNGQTMPLDYASYQISLGRFEEAIETLEQGRALIWSEMRGLRTPIAQLAEEDPPLAKRFAEVNQELGGLTISVTPSARQELEMGDGVAQDRDWTDPFGRLLVKQQKLVEERDALISQIQGRSGLEEFLKTPSFTTLRSAALRGPIVLINHCRWRSDILILTPNSLPRAIPTAEDFYECANKLRDELVEARKHGLDSDKYQAALGSVLKGLYKLVGEPVINGLHLLLGVPEQSQVWWCPTSVFCSLPLHAMGPIPSGDTSDRYFSDLYVPSYTPSLSALIESRKASPQMLDKPSLLLVAQPDDSLPGVWGEMNVVQALNARVTNLVSDAAIPSSVVEGLRGSRFAHFACHGELEIGKPFEASFKLHGGSRLTLLDIVQSRLPDAEFAFLSCCHTAEITEDSIADEALHLTAAMQYCGFRSVVGTMWAMADTDGRDLAKSFYKSLFSGRWADVPYYERSAGALRDATQKLRKKRGMTLERWVNFVHYGA